jgi:NTP pyrophosphatase (non-canonical NTP hydrolase)
LSDEFQHWLTRLRACTDAFEREKGSWSMDSQIAHCHSEVSEVYQAIRHNEERARIGEEICDSILSAFTMAHIAGFSDGELGALMELTLQKVEKRAGIRQ